MIQILFSLFFFTLSALQVDTFYGAVDVEEPLLIDLIESPAFQRLKEIHQYGAAYYTTHREEYTRYNHSLGVFVILRAKGASLEEQAAGLLHDVSHTVFSHVGDWLFGKQNQEKDYQNSIHERYLTESGLTLILEEYGLTAEELIPTEEAFPMLEQRGPNLCADRIDYNIQGAYYQGLISREEALAIFEEIEFVEGNWVSENQELMTKLARSALLMTQTCWGGVTNHLHSQALADAILRGLEIGLISYEDIHFGTDREVWNALIYSQDPDIQEQMERLLHAQDYYTLVDPAEADLIVKSKFRGIDPWILSDGKVVRLTAIDRALAEEYQSVKEKLQSGWSLKIVAPTPP